MQKNSFKIYNFVNEFNLSDLHQLSKDICIIYRNYDGINYLENILKLKKYCKNTKKKIYLSNDIKLSIKLRLDGVYIPSFNNKINYVQNYSLPKNFNIIGSAHNITEINLKLKQKCSEIFLSPVFKVNKSKKFLGISRFNLMTLNKKAYFIALGGINEKNYKTIKLLNSNGFSSISWAKKNGLRKLRPF
ncbi:thiamine phosphate synthase [Candidatus Pelagibacter sp.]|nr:thiamine phosphate synthase [Candidatus Pelagibacter sp.]